MITINNDTDCLVDAAVLGEFTLADFQQLENAAEHAIKFQGKARLLVDLRDMIGFTLDVAWEEIKLMRTHGEALERIAIVTDDQWLQWSSWLTRIFTNAEVQVFEDYEPALAWSRA
ncbi:MAG: STAS/SEC14 domain-containing protein, partial [Methylobacterium sp.]|nr:STAS/SEC14 domain-containing protein [Methylobacterium sp.]